MQETVQDSHPAHSRCAPGLSEHSKQLGKKQCLCSLGVLSGTLAAFKCPLGLVKAALLCAKNQISPWFLGVHEKAALAPPRATRRNLHRDHQIGTLHRGRGFSDSCQPAHYRHSCLLQRPLLPATLCGGLSLRWLTLGSAKHLALAACLGMPEDASAEER